MKRFEKVFITAALAASCLFMSAAAISPDKLYEEAQGLMISGEYLQAAEQLEKCSFYEDAASLAVYCRASALASEGKHLEASEAFRQIGEYRDSSLQADFCYAYALAFEDPDVQNVLRGAELLDEIGVYKDSTGLALQARGRAEELKNSAAYVEAESLFSAGRYMEAYKAYTALGGYRNSSERAGACLEKAYAEANSLDNQGRYSDASDAFRELGLYKDSDSRADTAMKKALYQEAENLEKQGNYKSAGDKFADCGSYSDSAERSAENLKKYRESAYEKAGICEQEGKYEEARDLFLSLGSYSDSAQRAAANVEKLNELRYEEADRAEKNGDYQAAYDAFSALGTYRDSASRAITAYEELTYTEAMALVGKGSYEEAFISFCRIEGFSDSEEKEYLSGAVFFADEMQRISDEIAVYSFENEWGIVNFAENIMIHPSWQSIELLPGTERFIVEKNGKFGLTDLEGNRIVPCEWSSWERASSKALIIGKDNLYGMADLNGNILIEPAWVSYEYISNVIAYQQQKKSAVMTGLASREGKLITEARWDDITRIDNQFAMTEYKKKFGLIDYEGTVLTKCIWNRISPRIENGVFLAEKKADGSRTYDLMDLTGSVITPYPVKSLGSGSDSLKAQFCCGQMLFETDEGKFGFIDNRGNLIEPVYDDTSEFAQNRCAVKLDGFWGYIDTDGTSVVENKYLYAGDFSEYGYATVRMQDGRLFALDIDGKASYYEDTRYNRAKEYEKAGEYEKAIELYSQLDVYDDSERRIVECSLKLAEELTAAEKYEEASEVYLKLNEEKDTLPDHEYRISLGTYNQALALEKEEKYDIAEELFGMIPDFKDTPYQIRRIHAANAFNLFDRGRYAEARDGFMQLEGYEDMVSECSYQEGLKLMEAGDYSAAYEILLPEVDYRDVRQLLSSPEMIQARFGNIEIGGTVTFGNYIQNGKEPEPIEWIVLAEDEEKFLLVSKYGLDAKPFNENGKVYNWEDSTLRKWLNTEFRMNAFDAEEQRFLKLNENDKNVWDRVFILSSGESSKYFITAEDRITNSTQYARENGALETTNNVTSWWIRSTAGKNNSALQYVGKNGIFAYYYNASNSSIAVRPAVWISKIPEQARTFSSKDFQKEYADVAPGDTVLFGTYEQDNNPATWDEPIEWTILDVQDGKALLISEYGIDCHKYNDAAENVTWETCTLREWLNDDFLNSAFSVEEQNLIEISDVSEDKNPKGSTDSGNATKDRIFLLSLTEAEKYFSDNIARRCAPTAYAKNKGALSGSIKTADGKDACWWWLRSPGNYQYFSTNVNNYGYSSKDGINVYIANRAVRPALWVKLAS